MKFLILPIILLLSNYSFSQNSILLPDSSKTHCSFGTSLCIGSTNLIIGSSGGCVQADTFQGRVYFYKLMNNRWQFLYEIKPESKEQYLFGRNILYKDSLIFISSSVGPPEIAKASRIDIYIICEDSIKFKNKIIINHRYSERYGCPMDISDSLLAIGVPNDRSNFIRQGSVHIFQFIRDKWSQIDTIFPPSQSQDIRFGGAVKFYHSNLIVAAPDYDTINNTFAAITSGSLNVREGENTGKVYYFKRDKNEWILSQELFPGPQLGGMKFGSTIMLLDTILFISGIGNFGFSNWPNYSRIYSYCITKDTIIFHSIITTTESKLKQDKNIELYARKEAIGSKFIVKNNSIIYPIQKVSDNDSCMNLYALATAEKINNSWVPKDTIKVFNLECGDEIPWRSFAINNRFIFINTSFWNDNKNLREGKLFYIEYN